ncbi:MAG: DUF2065 family protein [Rhizobiaceae bacterium]
MVELLSIIGVFLAIEGALYAGAPSMAKRMAADIAEMDEATLRRGGIAALVIGVGLVWLVRG